MLTGRNQFSQYLTYNPDLRERAIVDRIYHSFKNTPYANRRLIVQAVQFSEVRQYTRNFAQDKLKFTKLSAGTRSEGIELRDDRRYYAHPIASTNVFEWVAFVLS